MRPKHLAKIRLGFTLVEMVVALAIASMLMAAIAGVLVMSHRQLNLVADSSQTRWQSSVSSIMRRDFLQASHIHVDNDWIWLSGEFSNHGSPTAANSVGYGVAPWMIEGQTALVRVCGTEGQPLVVGPNRLIIERLDDSGTPQPLSAQPTAISKQLRLWVWQADSSSPELIRDLVVH
jgi:prepilin-type N-terminal cleavage/methylation domain-containing protein